MNNPSEDKSASFDGSALARDTFFGRLEWIALLSVLIVVVLAYPLRLQASWLMQLGRYWDTQPGWFSAWTRAAFQSYVNFFHSPLVFKGTLAALAMVLFIGIRLARLIVAPVTSERVAPQPSPSRWAWASVACFFAWLAVSALWSPTPELARFALVWVILFAVFMYLLLRRGLSLDELRILAIVMVAMGVLVALIVFLQAFTQKIYLFMIRFDDLRNRYGSLLGHNSAASSYLMMTAFPALALALGVRGRLARWSLILYLGVVLFAEVVLQSRAIWVFGPILGLLAVRSMVKHLPKGRVIWIPTALLAALVLALLTQVIDRPWNPLYVRDNPFGRRIKALMPEGLRGESRLRLNIIGATLVPERPLFGHGLYAFQYIYPGRQGEYFTRHPDSRLNQTSNFSHMAHNEYLQVLIDEGAVGLALLLWMLGEVAARGWRRRKALTGPSRLLQEAFGWSALGFALHGFVDFPFHIPQLAVPGFFCLVGWGSCRDGFLSVAPAAQPSASSGAFRPAHFTRLLAAMVVLGAVPLASMPFARAFQADIFYCRAAAHLQTYYDYYKDLSPSQRETELLQANREFRRTLQIEPVHPMAQFKLGEAYWQLGRLYGLASDAGKASEAIPAARQMLQNGLAMADQAARSLDFVGIYWLRANLYQVLDTLEPGGPYAAKYRRQLEMSVRNCPAFPQAVQELAELLASDPNPDMERILHLRRLVLRTDPGLFGEKYVMPMNHLVAQCRYESAMSGWDQIIACDPENPEWISTTALMHLLTGDRAGALRWTDRLAPFPKQVRFAFEGELVAAAAKGDWNAMLGALHQTWSDDPTVAAKYAAMEQEVLRRLGRKPVNEWIQKPSEVDPEQWNELLADQRPAVLLHWLSDPQGARAAFQARLNMPGEPPIEFWLEGYYIGRSTGDVAFARSCLEHARRIDPKHPALDELERRLGAKATP